jgi:signal transduction histidine kinase
VYFRDVTEHKRAEEEIRRSEEAQRFLAEAKTVLSSSLDYKETLASVARLAVPTLADWCAVDVLEEDGSVERVAVEHPDPRKVSLAYELEERYPPEPEEPGGVRGVLREGSPVFYPEITDEMLAATARDEEHLKLLREIGFTSAIIVPMIARGRTLGVTTLVSAESGRRYGEADLRLAEELARRTALAVDNARLYAEAQREIDERRWAQEELRGSKDQLEAILRGVADGITAQDPTGKIIYANETAARLVGSSSAKELVEAPREEVMGRFELLDAEDNPLPLEKLPGRRALAGEESAEEHGEVRMAVNIFRDVTESKRAEEALRQVREAERRRIARDLHDGVLQDLSYTAAAMGMIMLQAEEVRLKEQLQATIEAVRRGAEGLREVVNDLRLEDEEGRPFTEIVDSLVRRNRMMSRNTEIRFEVGERIPATALGETGTQLSRIIQEALTNARRHASAKRISVSLSMDGDNLLLEVSDDGVGFVPESLPGVGLRSMRERVELIGGELEIESAEERGTSVRLRVPLPQRTLE